MRLVQISNQTLINPEYISHITVREEPAPNAGSRFAHSYPVYRITMYDGKWYDVAYINEYPSIVYPFMPIDRLLEELTK